MLLERIREPEQVRVRHAILVTLRRLLTHRHVLHVVLGHLHQIPAQIHVACAQPVLFHWKPLLAVASAQLGLIL